MAEADRLRERGSHAAEPRHGGGRDHDIERGHFASSFLALGALAYEGAEVSARIIDLTSGDTLLSIDDRIVLPTARVGSLLLLIDAAARLEASDPSVANPLGRDTVRPVGQAGLWRHLDARSMSVADLAVLVAGTGDTLATNVLLRTLGPSAVRERAESLGLVTTALLDRVRDDRGPDDAPYFSVGSTWELAGLLAGLTRGEIVSPPASERVLGWLARNTDLSLVASAFGLDPLSHGRADHGIHLVNTTGSDVGLRAETGAVRGPRSAVAYAVTVRFTDRDLPVRLRVLEALRAVGSDILEYVN